MAKPLRTIIENRMRRSFALLPLLLFLLPLFFLLPLWLSKPYRLYLLVHGHAYPQYTWINYTLVTLRKGQLPLWFPHIGAGYPNASSIYNELLNPFFLMLLPAVNNGKLPYVAYEFGAAVQWSLAGVTFYWLMRHLKVSRPGAFVGALAYLFNFYNLGQFLLWSATAKVMVWMPVAFACLYEGFVAAGLRRWLLLTLGGAVFGLTYTHPYTSIVSLVFLVGFTVVGSWVCEPGGSVRRAGMAILTAGVFVTASICGSAAFFLPFVESMLFNPRIQTSPPYWVAFTTSGFMESVLSLILPDFVLTFRWSYMGPGFLMLAILGALRGSWLVRFLVGSTIVALLVALAQWSALYYVLFNLVPTWSAIREKATSLHVSAFCIPLLVGLGWDRAVVMVRQARRLGRNSLKWVTWVLLGLGVLSAGNEALVRIAGRPPGNSLMSMRTLGLLAAGTLLLIVRGVVGKRLSFRAGFVLTALLLLLNQLAPLWFVREYRPSHATPAYMSLIEDPVRPVPDRILEHRTRSDDAQPWLAFINRRGTVNDFGSQSLFRFWKLTALAGISNGTPPFYLPVMGIERGNRRHLLDLLDVEDANAPVGRFVLVRDARIATNADAALEAVATPGIDFREVVILEELVGGDYHSRGPSGVPGRTSDTKVDVVRYGPTLVELRVDNAEARRFLLFVDNWYPGWHARIEGKRVPVLRADYAFKAVPIPPGTFHVLFEFRPRSFWLGLWVTAVTWLGMGAAWFTVTWWRRCAQ
jgi:hypothetical protein